MAGGQDFAHAFDLSPTHFGALRDQASDVILTGIPEQRTAETHDCRTSDQPESGKHDKVLQMFSLNVNLLTNLVWVLHDLGQVLQTWPNIRSKKYLQTGRYDIIL